MAPTPAVRPRTLTAAERVATVLMTMGQSAATTVMKHMDPTDLRTITLTMSDLKPVPVPQIDELVDDFVKEFGGGTSLVGDASQVQKLLSGVLPDDQIADIVAEMEGRVNEIIWDKLSVVPDASISGYLAHEHPQTAALILSKLQPTMSAKIIGAMSTEDRDSVARRMLNIKVVVDDALGVVESALHDDFMLNISLSEGGDSHAKMAEIINKMESEQMESLLSGIEAKNPKSAEVLRSLLFTFDDIVKLNPKALQTLLDGIGTDQLTLALKGTNEQFRRTVLGCLASRTKRMVEQDLASGEPSTQREVMEARRTITERALQLGQRGEIELSTGDDDGEMLQ